MLIKPRCRSGFSKEQRTVSRFIESLDPVLDSGKSLDPVTNSVKAWIRFQISESLDPVQDIGKGLDPVPDSGKKA